MKTPSIHQLETARSNSTVTSVVAAAGSGKTATIIERYRYLLSQECGYLPSEVVVITFTIAAGEELKRRIAEAGLTPPKFVGTIHSMCASYLPQLFPGVSLASQDIADMVLEKVKGMFPKDKLPNVDKTPIEELEKNRVYSAYQAHMRNAKLVDFRNLIVGFGRNEHAAKIASGLHVIVDEYQDTTKDERRVVELFKTRFVVGDPRQQLYQFRGATEWWPVHHKILPVSYRVPKVAGEFVNRIKFPFLEPMVCHNEGGLVEKAWVEGFLKKEGSKALLCRSNREVEQWVGRLTGMGVNVIRPLPVPADLIAYADWLDASLHPTNSYIIEQYLKLSPDLLKAAEALAKSRLQKLADVVVVAKEYPFTRTPAIEKMEAEYPDPADRLCAIRQLRSTIPEGEGVRVSTIHGFKGLEADHVYVVVPEHLKDTMENKCLMYVAFTRCRSTLSVEYPRDKPDWLPVL